MIYKQFSEFQEVKIIDLPVEYRSKPYNCVQEYALDFDSWKNYHKSPAKPKTIKLDPIEEKEDAFEKLLKKIEKVKQEYQNDQDYTPNFIQHCQSESLFFQRKVKSKPESPEIIKSPRKMKTLKGTESIFGIDKENYTLTKVNSLSNLNNWSTPFEFNRKYDSIKENLVENKRFQKKNEPYKNLFSEQNQNVNNREFNFLKVEKENRKNNREEFKKRIHIDRNILEKIPVRQSINFDLEIPDFIANNLGETKKEELKFSDFEIGTCIGSGKFGEVYICKHKRTNFICALKKILKSTIEEYKMVDQFVRELKISYMVDHPNIVKTYGHFHDEFHVFILMEFAGDGNTIDSLEKKKGEEFSSKVLFQTLNAVDHLHQLNIVHRDIKPENIIVFFKDTFKLCDFGLSAFVQNDMKHTFCGTLDYLSPEMKDVGEYNLSVDLWSLGVLAFELIVGEAPFKDKISEWKKSGWKKSSYWKWKVEYPKEISEIAKNFMKSLLKEKPEERMNLNRCLRHEFVQINNKKEINIIKASEICGF